MQHDIILASTSQTRQRLMAASGVRHHTAAPTCNEDTLKSTNKHLSSSDLSGFLAFQKALSLSSQFPNALIIGSDQILDVGGKRLTKARHRNEAKEQLLFLRGKAHQLYSAITCCKNHSSIWTYRTIATLHMRNFSDRFLENYLEICGVDILHSVGAYQIENQGIQLFDTIEGDYHSIMGFPILPLLKFLREKDYISS